jgi:hypothetical protein
MKTIKPMKTYLIAAIAALMLTVSAYADDLDVTITIVEESDSANITESIMSEIELPTEMMDEGREQAKRWNNNDTTRQEYTEQSWKDNQDMDDMKDNHDRDDWKDDQDDDDSDDMDDDQDDDDSDDMDDDQDDDDDSNWN